MTKAPSFSLQSDTNQTISLKDLTGKKVLLFFFPKAGTPGCTTQACGFRDHFTEITDHNATVVGISPDSPAQLAEWKKQAKLPFMLLSDPDHRVAEAYGAWGERSMFGYKYQGIIRSHFVIDEHGNLVQEERKIGPKDSVKKGLKAILKSS
ncbi:thioredoxin-dependent thiol peroxidase [Patescibacteria group bacterium]|nr:thioredoxin-dependent thiol peroxidase [Patescibacteria group bacterium]